MMEKIENMNKRLTETEKNVRNLTDSGESCRVELKNSSSLNNSELSSTPPSSQINQTVDSFVSKNSFEMSEFTIRHISLGDRHNMSPRLFWTRRI